MTPADAAWAAGQHAALMRNSTFAVFGPTFLERFYRRFALSPHGIAFVAEEHGEPVGVIASTSNRPAFLRELMRRSGLILAGIAAWRFLTRTPCRRMILESARYLRKTRQSNGDAEMVFITVQPRCRGRGVGRDLIEATLNAYREREIHHVHVSIEAEKPHVREMLEAFGFEEDSRFVFADKPHLLMKTCLAGNSDGNTTTGGEG